MLFSRPLPLLYISAIRIPVVRGKGRFLTPLMTKLTKQEAKFRWIHREMATTLLTQSERTVRLRVLYCPRPICACAVAPPMLVNERALAPFYENISRGIPVTLCHYMTTHCKKKRQWDECALLCIVITMGRWKNKRSFESLCEELLASCKNKAVSKHVSYFEWSYG